VAVVVDRQDEGVFIANSASFGEKKTGHCLNIVAEPFMLYENEIGVLLVFGIYGLCTHLTRIDSLRCLSGSMPSMFSKSDV